MKAINLTGVKTVVATADGYSTVEKDITLVPIAEQEDKFIYRVSDEDKPLSALESVTIRCSRPNGKTRRHNIVDLSFAIPITPRNEFMEPLPQVKVHYNIKATVPSEVSLRHAGAAADLVTKMFSEANIAACFAELTTTQLD